MMYGARMKRQEKSKDSYNLDQQLGLEWVFIWQWSPGATWTNTSIQQKESIMIIMSARRKSGGKKQNKNSPDDAEQGYVDPTAQT